MNSQKYTPGLEHLESKLMLNAAPVAEIADPAASAVIFATHTETLQRQDIEFQIEQHSNTLLVKLDKASHDCLMCEINGEVITFDAGDLARINVPPDTRSLDVTILDRNGDSLGTIRLEMDTSGAIVHQMWLESDASEPSMDLYVISPDRADAFHSASHSVAPPLAANSNHSTNTEPDGDKRALHAGSVDVAMAGHFSDQQSFSSDRMFDFDHAPQLTHPSTPMDGNSSSQTTRTASEHLESSESSENASTESQVIAEMAVEEEFDFVAENWAGEAPVAAADVPLAKPTLATILGAAAPAAVPEFEDLVPIRAMVASVAYSQVQPTTKETTVESSRSFPLVLGLGVSAFAAGAAIILDRKSKQQEEQAAQHPELPGY